MFSHSHGEADAQNSRLGLERRMTRLLTSNANLSSRMRNLIDIFEARGGRMNREALPHYTRSSGQNSLPTPSSSPPTRMATTATPDDTIESEPTSRNRVWSPLSGYTLADVPVLSVIPLPVVTVELRDGNEFYTFAFVRHVSQDLDGFMRRQPGPGSNRGLTAMLSSANSKNTSSGNSTSSGSSGSSAAKAKGFVERIGLNITRKRNRQARCR